MSTQNWQEIWNRRAYDLGSTLDLGALIKLDGFDVGAGRIEVSDWQAYVGIISNKLGISDGATVYEIGCGAGAFLYALCQRHNLTVGGLDYSKALISAATRALPDGEFNIAAAKSVGTSTTYDFVMSNGVFHYFSQEYAAEVLARMIKKARIAVAVLEVPDLETKQESEAFRRDKLTQEEYEKKYAGLEHTYYERDWFKTQAIENGCDYEIFDGCVPNYAQNPYRFGVILKKSHSAKCTKSSLLKAAKGSDE
ncbi:methyltransferase type 12 [Methyloglobulus morosus KoM1]|uniref:Methyltransferase type 12 n=1 Tax=Methyloglobulus morosus KoM1 TaxID=1116472 RepID=V5E3F5_9GAMM|nr:class I SAM-dependent methyltransferase [Methyloglobulus morosus]ESS74086.1 methyltransferase type 12 [Methyloglobulus morosus KoM1]